MVEEKTFDQKNNGYLALAGVLEILLGALTIFVAFLYVLLAQSKLSGSEVPFNILLSFTINDVTTFAIGILQVIFGVRVLRNFKNAWLHSIIVLVTTTMIGFLVNTLFPEFGYPGTAIIVIDLIIILFLYLGYKKGI
ncbi:TPA: hypothetical protein DDW69_02440 [candidate division CPR2 bacterium]|uniref:Uncharacterized protein n=1 Tax=candidate division CPR2 bacterium GW2011_GWC1_41_48 TaxID=1618344 RepID=A0A0G0WA72_UNCC2|nr:MAG: hypothetical protein UT47_C0001G0290 [candidate division CPR2 bacterium GW2011_GWC2_39_35]KKR27627.1 MAG: hypothetical protein UT59_C0051G0008 [candidate division CPR2 bacterium GW2011_GWD1_39_7]KKR28842.1 MAG: hypothetical protein UT60_C0011G0008 [candidate division CPR2 bacterium GW2011_GWD2_39_7]KKS09885.1 MAG: hypothetical protein UU65_C0001G0290 [candidate division CPR2 bacterium GW2011_GWC1_41_48]OGB59449.1 MAG: hypothetical protein A2Y27_03860 [candidate division CPR2 bacterium G